MKRILFTLAITLGMVLPSFANIASGTCGTNLTWVLSDDGCLTISGTGAMYNWERSPWYNNRASIAKVIIEEGITSIGNYAFRDCSALTNITIPNSVTSIGNYAFVNCSALPSITIPNSVASIDYLAFRDCSALTSITIANSTTIGSNAFYINNIKEVNINITDISKNNDLPNHLYNATTWNYFINGNPVTSIPTNTTGIGEYALYKCTTITTAQIPEGITNISNHVFQGCTALTNITIPNSIISIGDYALSGCSALSDITLPEGITNIGRYAFNGCEALTDIIIPNSVTSIGDNAFWYCSTLTSVTIPNSVSIESSAFYGCSKITEANINITDISKNNMLVKELVGYRINVTYNFFIDGEPVTSIPTNATGIGDYALYKCTTITTADIPDGITNIGNYAFNECSALTNLFIPGSITDIGNYAFKGCSTLTNLSIPEGVTNIGEYAFDGCSALTDIVIPNSIISIGYGAFRDCRAAERITIPNSVTSIGSSAFAYCNKLSELNVNITDISKNSILRNYITYSTCTWNYFIDGMPVTSIPADATAVGDYALYKCTTITTADIPDGATSIGNYAFQECSELTSVNVGSGVTSIGKYAFQGCSELKSVNVGSGITCIADYAFDGCKILGTVYINAPAVPTLGTNTLPNTTVLIVPDALLNDYKSATNWSNYAANFVGMSKTDYDVTVTKRDDMSALHTAIGDNQLLNVVSLKVSGTINSYDLMVMRNKMFHLRYLDLSDATLVENAYEHVTGYHSQDNTLTGYSLNENLVTLILPRNLKAIGDYALAGCKILSNVEIPTGVQSIGDFAFKGCTSLTSIDVPDAVHSIGNGAFSGCSAMKSITLPFVGSSDENFAASGNFGYIFGTAFYAGGKSCNNFYIPTTLRSVRVKNGYVSNNAFKDCSMLTEIEVPSTLTRIGIAAFQGCSELTSFHLPEALQTICHSAFRSCSKLNNITLPDQLQSIEQYAFNGCSSLEHLDIPAQVTSIGTYAFADCSKMRECILPTNSQLETIPNYAFQGCTQLQRMDLPVSVTTIGAYAFRNCSAMAEVKLPTSITSLGNYAFTGCNALNDVYTYTIEPQQIDQNTFSTYHTAVLHCPAASYSKYFYNTQWSQFLEIVAFDEPYDYVYIKKDFDIYTDATGGISGEPEVDIEHEGGVTVNGDAEQYFSDIHIHDHDGSCGSIIGHNGNLHGQRFFFEIDVNADVWYAFSFPFDVHLSNGINKDGSWVFYGYDGDTRAQGQTGWTRVENNGVLKAGEGYIFSTNSTGKLTVIVNNPDLSGNDEVTALQIHGDNNTPTADKNWNFVGNRYTSYFDINELNYTAPVVTFDGVNYDAFRPGDDELVLRPFQAFFVQKPNSVDDMTFDQEGRTTYLSSQDKKNSPAKARKAARLNQNRQLINLVVSDGENEDKTRVVFNDEQSLEYEMECDASKFMSNGAMPLIYTLDANNTRYAINERPEDNGIVRLGFIARKKGDFTIEASRMDTPVLLYDAVTNTTTDLSEGAYHFESNGGTFNDRFQLVVANNMTAIESVKEMTKRMQGKSHSYNMSGRRAADGEKGVIIRDHQKVMVK